MKCEDVESAMIDYLDKVLDKEQCVEIEKHLERCERCLDELTAYQQLLKDIETSGNIQPDETLRINFYHMLHSEINKQAVGHNKALRFNPRHYSSSIWLKVAAGIALLLCGTFIGVSINSVMNTKQNKGEEVQLRSEIQNLKEMMMFSLLQQESPSERLQAVSLSDEIQAPDQRVFEALIYTLNHDENVNVRLAAAYSLAKFADRKMVRDSLVASLAQQKGPIIQVVLINILVENRESDAINTLQRMLSDENTLKEVKDIAEKGIKVLL